MICSYKCLKAPIGELRDSGKDFESADCGHSDSEIDCESAWRDSESADYGHSDSERGLESADCGHSDSERGLESADCGHLDSGRGPESFFPASLLSYLIQIIFLEQETLCCV